MGSLTLVGTIHRDPHGFPKLMEILEGESPDIITVEVSEYGVAFRERNGPRLKERLFQILRGPGDIRETSQGGNPRGPQNPFQAETVVPILLTVELPYEFRAVKAYCELTGIPFRCIDLMRYSRTKLKALQEEMITEDNLRKILELGPGAYGEEMQKQRFWARRLISKNADQFFVEAFLNGRRGDGMARRDRYMSFRIREIMRDGGETLHVGGWEHLLNDPKGRTLYTLLKDLSPRRILSL
jgi:hypothetical protein